MWEVSIVWMSSACTSICMWIEGARAEKEIWETGRRLWSKDRKQETERERERESDEAIVILRTSIRKTTKRSIKPCQASVQKRLHATKAPIRGERHASRQGVCRGVLA